MCGCMNLRKYEAVFICIAGLIVHYAILALRYYRLLVFLFLLLFSLFKIDHFQLCSINLISLTIEYDETF